METVEQQETEKHPGLGKHLKKGFGLIRNFGWKKNLLAVAAGFLICGLIEVLAGAVSNIRVIAAFDLTVAVMPLIGFLLGIWGAAGCLLEALSSYLLTIWMLGTDMMTFLTPSQAVLSGLVMVLYCALPSMLWYAFPMKGEKRAIQPRLDTSAHVIKYYLVMVVSVAVFVALLVPAYGGALAGNSILDMAVLFTQYLDVVLIAGMPGIILISLIRNRTLSINERMVLAFLFIGVFAAIISAAIVYQNTLYLDKTLFEEYDQVLFSESSGMTAADMAAMERYRSYWNWYYVIMTIILNSLLLVEMLFMRSIEKKVTRPILHLAEVMGKYAENGSNGLDSGSVRAACEPFCAGYGEVSSLTKTYVDMVGEIDEYTENLQQVTAEKQRISTELDVASKIQRDMLPGIFPPFPDRHEVDLYASMTPAKEVGGDFYDFYFIDEDHLALTIADVSGKGVPAALFMVISKTLLKNHAQAGGSPKNILRSVNHQLCQNNDSSMFCTVWLGILDLKTGKLTASNAGHEYPVIRREGGTFTFLRDKHDLPLGIMDGIRYREYELTLAPGDCLFEYTDGVTEATNAAEELFGEERLAEALNTAPAASPENLIGKLYGAVHTFVQDAPQFDDITMLCVKYTGNPAGESDSTGNGHGRPE